MNTRFILYFVIPLALGVGITLIGAILLLIDWRKRAGEKKTGDWLPTGGKVTSVKQEGVQYVYTVNNTEHTGNVLPPKGSPLFSENMYVPVRYNPQNPEESALDNLPRPTNFIGFFGWLFTSFGLISCCFTGFMAVIILGATQ